VDPIAGNITGSTGISVTNGAGSITLATTLGGITPWTPQMYFGSTEVAGYTGQTGGYSVMGNLLVFSGYLMVLDKGGATGIASLSTPPITPVLGGGGTIGAVNNVSISSTLALNIESGSNRMVISSPQSTPTTDTGYVIYYSFPFSGFYFV
jgi:hypothetical protein